MCFRFTDSLLTIALTATSLVSGKFWLGVDNPTDIVENLLISDYQGLAKAYLEYENLWSVSVQTGWNRIGAGENNQIEFQLALEAKPYTESGINYGSYGTYGLILYLADSEDSKEVERNELMFGRQENVINQATWERYSYAWIRSYQHQKKKRIQITGGKTSFNLKDISYGDEVIEMDWIHSSDIKYNYDEGYFKRDWNPQDTVGAWNWIEELCDFTLDDDDLATFKVVMGKRDDPESLGLTQNIKVGGKIFGRFALRAEDEETVLNAVSPIKEFTWAQEEVGDEMLNLNSQEVSRSDTSRGDEATFGFCGATGAAIGATAALTFFMMRKQQKTGNNDRDEDFHRV